MASVSFSAEAKPGLIAIYRHELYKASRQSFYRMVVVGPLLIVLILMLIMTLMRLSGRVPAGIPDSNSSGLPYNLGTRGSFALSGTIFLAQAGQVYSLVVVMACALAVANEYRWNTIKMLAIREPSRVRLALAKGLFALTMVGAVFVVFSAIWLIFGLFLKVFYSTPLELTSYDLANIGKGLAFYAIISLQALILALLAIALSFHYKSVLGGILGVVIYKGLDMLLTLIGTQGVNRPYGTSAPADWIKPLWDLAAFLNPYLLTGSVNRLTMAETVQSFPGSGPTPNPQIALGNPVWLAWEMLLIYAVLFTALAVTSFSRRDITD